jgi:hypothetical protein
LRWRLQHIAEDEVGKRVREAGAAEEAAAERALGVVNELG